MSYDEIQLIGFKVEVPFSDVMRAIEILSPMFAISTYEIEVSANRFPSIPSL